MINNLDLSYTLLLGLAIILFTGLLFGKIAKKIKVPNVTGYLLGGLLIGPALLGLIFPEFKGVIGKEYIDALSIFASIELGFIAFSVGSEFKMSFMKQVGPMPVIIAFAESFFAVVFITVGLLIFQFPLYFALAMGAVGAATAPAATILVIRQYKAKGILAKTTMSVVALDDASALIFFGICMAVIRSIIKPNANITLTIIMPFIEIIGSLLLGIISGFVLSFFIKFFKSKGNRMCLSVAMIFFNIAFCLLLQEYVSFGSGDSQVFLSLSSLLSCMAMGAIFSNFSNSADETMEIVDRVTPPFVIIFFVLSGADLQLSSLTWIAVAAVAIYLVFRVAGKVIGTMVGAKVGKAPDIVKKYLGWGLLPQGGIAIGLSLIIMQEIPESVHPVFNGMLVRIVVICAVFISEIFGPILLKKALVKSGEIELPSKDVVAIDGPPAE